MNSTLITIDPGCNGGIAVRHAKQAVAAYKMPATEGDVLGLLAAIRVTAVNEARNIVAVIEDQIGCVGPSMRVSGTAMFTFGRGFGFLLGVLQATHWRIHLVRPQKWQTALALGSKSDAGGKVAWKNKLKARAQQLYPHLDVILATADALLLMEYALKARLD